MPLLLVGQLSYGLEFQAYPTGLIPGIRLAKSFNPQDELNLRLGANLFDHQDFGVQEEERGWGLGGTLGYRRYLRAQTRAWFLGGRVDVWRSNNNWRSGVGTVNETSGTTQIVVLQPTIEAGYRFGLGSSWIFSPGVGFGLEWNVISRGEDVGQGPILLVGFSFMRSP